ncbi:hypothetical protein SMQC20_46500 [Serratia marcescens]|nr:hypothetical protein SMQC20_46500 [Serratia marcescens]
MEKGALSFNSIMNDDNDDGCFNEAINILETKRFKRVKVPDKIHFIWIGDLKLSNISYIKVWSDINKNKSVFLWIDITSSFVNLFQQSLKSYCDDSGKDIFYLRNKAFDYIWPKIKQGETFNDAASKFLDTINHEYVESGNFSKHIPESINIMNIQELFSNEFIEYKKFYYYELILRNNLACASDFLRLLVLHRYGGVYIDIDTLPYIDNIYQKTNVLLDKLNIRHDENVYLAKSHAFLCKFNYVNDSLADSKDYLKKIENINDVEMGNVFCAIILDINHVDFPQISSLGDIYVYDNLISISTVKFINGVFFNNIIASTPSSRFLKNLLKRVEFNYNYIEKNKKIFDAGFLIPSFEGERAAFGFLLNYRRDVISENEFVTFYLAGPKLISNTIYRVICGLTGLHRILPIDKLAKLMQNDVIGIGFQKQTLDTPLGTKSTWREKDE